jgi:hypothetical protein
MELKHVKSVREFGVHIFSKYDVCNFIDHIGSNVHLLQIETNYCKLNDITNNTLHSQIFCIIKYLPPYKMFQFN